MATRLNHTVTKTWRTRRDRRVPKTLESSVPRCLRGEGWGWQSEAAVVWNHPPFRRRNAVASCRMLCYRPRSLCRNPGHED
ncbi:protein of unknown function [Azospirillum baldaniorum]|uniref:Uncharacterized protein n=1 Tax=Azospirillum baldaniorum TaxID=1064539 RepID=A0A9P1JS97_9PROT|nr:protein of unknown function [Azospirillum baldaniorum]